MKRRFFMTTPLFLALLVAAGVLLPKTARTQQNAFEIMKEQASEAYNSPESEIMRRKMRRLLNEKTGGGSERALDVMEATWDDAFDYLGRKLPFGQEEKPCSKYDFRCSN